MIPRRTSLRSRVLRAFLAASLIAGPLIAVALLFISVELQQWAAERTIRDRLATVVADPAGHALRDWDEHGHVRVLTDVPLGRIPAALMRLPDGMHELEQNEASTVWLLAITTAGDGRRYAMIRDASAIEAREQQGLGYALAGTGLALALAVFAAGRVARRLTAPLEELARRVAATRGAPGQPVSNAVRGTDEVRFLAEALDDYSRRTSAAIERERRFAADASHELRTPLTIISNATEILVAEDLPPRSRRAVDRIGHAARRMEETTTTLLSLVREPQAAGHAAVSIAGRLEAVVDAEFDAAGAHADTPQVTRELHAWPVVHAPQAVVDTILANLVRNALVHARATRIRVMLEPVRLQVIDDGVGFPRAAAGIRDDNADPAAESGLGLSLVRRLCERFGWSIELQAEPGRGTTATWRFGPGERASADDNQMTSLPLKDCDRS